jgi:4-amino-4-deoxy-L-arabinose transferase-like glycosyltransferase
MAARVPTLRVPLDQDAAVYTYAAQHWLAGEVPYRDVWDHKAPFVYLLYAGIQLTAPVPVGAAWAFWLRVASALCDAVTLVLVFAVARRLFGSAVGLWAALLYGVFTAGPALQFEAFQPEHVMTLGVAGGMLAALVYAESRQLRHAALCGALFGLGLAAKQTAAPLVAFAWAWLTWEALRRRPSEEAARTRSAPTRILVHTLLLAGGVALPWLFFAAYFWARGAFDDFWACAYTYNARYAAEDRTRGDILEGSVRLLKAMAPFHAFLWLTAAAGLLTAAARSQWRGGVLVAGWTLCAFLSCLIPGQASPYYFIQTVVPLALAAGMTAASLRESLRRGPVLDVRNVLPGLILAGLLALGAKRELDSYREATDPQSGNQVVVNIGRYLKARTGPHERLYVWGSRPQVYVIAERQNACRFLYNFSYNQKLDEAYHFRQEKLAEIVAALREHQPPFIVATETETLKGFPALADFLAQHYTLQSTDGFQHEWPTNDRFIPLVRVYRRMADGPLPSAQ